MTRLTRRDRRRTLGAGARYLAAAQALAPEHTAADLLRVRDEFLAVWHVNATDPSALVPCFELLGWTDPRVERLGYVILTTSTPVRHLVRRDARP